MKIDLKGNIEMQKILIANPVNISNIIFTNQLPMLRHGNDNVLCSQILTSSYI